MHFFKSLFGSRNHFFFCFKKVLERQFYRSYLGLSWIFIRVLFSFVTYAILFGVIFEGRDTRIDYFDHILSGLMVWSIFIGGLNWGTKSFEILKPIRSKIFLPEGTMVIAGIVSGTVSFIPWLIVFFIFDKFFSIQPKVFNFFFLIAILQIYLFTISITLLTSVLDAFGRDSRYAVSLLSGWCLFCTPVFYEITDVPIGLRWIVIMNPITPILENFRYGIYGRLFETNTIIFFILTAMVFISSVLFSKYVFNLRANL